MVSGTALETICIPASPVAPPIRVGWGNLVETLQVAVALIEAGAESNSKASGHFRLANSGWVYVALKKGGSVYSKGGCSLICQADGSTFRESNTEFLKPHLSEVQK